MKELIQPRDTQLQGNDRLTVEQQAISQALAKTLVELYLSQESKSDLPERARRNSRVNDSAKLS